MSVATLQPTYSAVPAAPAPTLECPSCGSSMALTPNPYFGTGLAQHRTLALCNGCHHIAFVAEAEQPQPEPGVAKRMLSLFSRR
ncbi:hypothetical protein OH146_05525 [Salinibacterium sp. SYSU T00001]|uniref:hypothetical protein n=1 Tax=Homoserinimonas sedimenticola TaxID=2986805 RepID=UPI0022368498|nr:hypothetical protein [Salinibacterium sedimenticola]MCW4385231.1 hypothetical protein [Salinibacterium sedimenticola]